MEQLPVKLLDLGRACRFPRRGLFGGRQGPVQSNHQYIFTQDHGHRLRRVARSTLLQRAGRLGDLLRHIWIGLVHRICLGVFAVAVFPEGQKKADVAAHPEVFRHVGLLANELFGSSRIALYPVIRQLFISRRAERTPFALHHQSSILFPDGESKGLRAMVVS